MKHDEEKDVAGRYDALQARLADLGAALNEVQEAVVSELAEQAAIIEGHSGEIEAMQSELLAAQAALEQERGLRRQAEVRLRAEQDRHSELRTRLIELASTLEPSVPTFTATPVAESDDDTEKDHVEASEIGETQGLEVDGEDNVLGSSPPSDTCDKILSIDLPDDLAVACLALVEAGLAPNMSCAALELLRRGLQVSSKSAKRSRHRILRE